MNQADINGLTLFLQDRLESMAIKDTIEKHVRDGSSSAGKSREGIFRQEFLCPAIAEYFYQHARQNLIPRLADENIQQGLGTEGYAKCPGFGFTPARKGHHLFTKSDVIKSVPPNTWLATSDERLPTYRACPDFAITSPLPMSLLGEVKYFQSGSPIKAVHDLYHAARQAIFYLGAFHGQYQAILLVVADGSKSYSFIEGMKLVKPALIRRFGAETDIYLLPIKLA